MLKKILIKNVKSFSNESILDLVCSKSEEFKEINTFNAGKDNLLKNILIYGANSSGKSNFINSLMLMNKVVLSNYDSQSSILRSIHPFIFDEPYNEKASELGVNFIADGIEYEYSFSVLRGKVVSEELYRNKKRRVMLFERTSPKYTDIKTSKEFAIENGLIKNLREDVLFLTFSSFFNNKIANSVKEFFEHIYFGNDTKEIPFHFINNGQINMDERYLNMIKLADNLIDNIALESNEYNEKNLFVMYKFQLETDKLNVKLPFDAFASSGTKHFYRILRYMIYVLENGGVFIMDEIDKHLHPFLTRKVIEMFNSISHNKGNAQLICTVHDVTLLEENLRRDQIYFINRDECGKSELYSLADFKGVRKEDNKLKRYLQGQYSAVPKF